MEDHQETELKFTIDDDRALPDLLAVEGVDSVGEPSVVDLGATYFDTDDLRLTRAGIALRRRTGGADEGWHLKVPIGEDSRVEHRLPLDAGTDTVPDELRDDVRSWVRRAPLEPVLHVQTRRTERSLSGGGRVLASVADDAVRAHRLGAVDPHPTTWREVEVELVGGTPALLGAAQALLSASGIERSPWPSKLAHGLGDRLPPEGRRKRLGSSSTVGEVVWQHLADQFDELVRQEPGARRGDPEAVHDMRVATRRLRSALATFRPVFDRSRTDPLRAELRWLGQALGDVRDADVLGERLAAAIDALPGELVVGPVRERARTEVHADHELALARLGETLGGERYLDLLEALDAVIATPPTRARSGRRAERELPTLVEQAARRVDRAAAEVPDEGAERALALHEVRKAAKRARYAAEVAAPVSGRPAKRLARRMEDLQEVLGAHQDTVDARRSIRRIGMAAHLAGENGFTFGLLHAQEAAMGAEAQGRYPRARARSSAGKARRWARR